MSDSSSGRASWMMAPDFITTLMALGFVSAGPVEYGPVETRRQGARRVQPKLVRPLFGRVAWTLYAGCAALVGALFALRPGLIPTSQDTSPAGSQYFATESKSRTVSTEPALACPAGALA